MRSTQLCARSPVGLRVRARKGLYAVPVVAAALVLAACSGGGANDSPSSTTNNSATGSAPIKAGTGAISIYVIGGKSDDPFWSKVKRGVDDAAQVVKAAGGSVTFLGPQNYDNLGPDAAKLTLTALSNHPSAVVGPDWVPDAQDAAWKQITASGTPVFLYNAGGPEAAARVGAVSYIGSQEFTAGQVAGKYMGTQGVKNVLCVNTLPGASNTEDRCKGIADGESGAGGKSKQLPLPSSNFGNPTAVAQAIKAALLKDSSVDGVITISTADADSAANAIQQANAGSKVKLATFDLDQTQLDRIKAGKQLLAIDQQPYLQGYLGVSMAYQYVAFGLLLPQNPILTGPNLITASNIDQAIAGAKAGVR
ncbi:MAG TPA: sugar ABC transporter substrate-binding protein [Mycobacteriales bacterium]|nr:sugar ABC transporter substrate-binding protein [Mycobacteriales bacterium]